MIKKLSSWIVAYKESVMPSVVIDTIQTVTDPHESILEDVLFPTIFDDRFDEPQKVYENPNLTNEKHTMVLRSDNIIRMTGLRRYRNGWKNAERHHGLRSGALIEAMLQDVCRINSLAELKIVIEEGCVIYLFKVTN